jgi:hypothetical protein
MGRDRDSRYCSKLVCLSGFQVLPLANWRNDHSELKNLLQHGYGITGYIGKIPSIMVAGYGICRNWIGTLHS